MKNLYTKLVGVSFGDRQKNIPKVSPGSRLFWKHERDNPWDENAILVYADFEKTLELGHLRRALAADIQKELRAGKKMVIWAERLTGLEDNQTYGLNIRLSLFDKEEGIGE